MKSISGSELISARETARRLNVKLDTLYAYVSRGLLRSIAVPDSRERRYRADEVERFRAGRGADRGRAALVPVIGSAITLIADGRFYYRGVDAVGLAATATLEEAAALLWDVGVGSHGAGSPAVPDGDPRSFPAREAAGAEAGLIARAQARLTRHAGADLAALDLTPAGVARTGRVILSELVAAVVSSAPGSAPASVPDDRTGDAPVHARLAAAWRLDPAARDLVRRCLVLIADHELNASAFVARCVASTGATPYAVVSAALSALSGRRHGGATARAEALFHEIGAHGDPAAVIAARLARGDDVPGLGHPLYPEGDPRAAAIIAAIGVARPAADGRAAASAQAALRLTRQHPNVDFALAAAARAIGLPAGGAFGLFLVGRTVGWIAHAIEQYSSDVLIRPRARYTGKPPRPAG